MVPEAVRLSRCFEDAACDFKMSSPASSLWRCDGSLAEVGRMGFVPLETARSLLDPPADGDNPLSWACLCLPWEEIVFLCVPGGKGLFSTSPPFPGIFCSLVPNPKPSRAVLLMSRCRILFACRASSVSRVGGVAVHHSAGTEISPTRTHSLTPPLHKTRCQPHEQPRTTPGSLRSGVY